MENAENMTECARSVVMLDGEISKYVNFVQGFAHTWMYNIFKV